MSDEPDVPGGRSGTFHSYRCPLCGHTDDVDLGEDAPVRIRCSHCGTLLEVQAGGGAVERVSVVVAREEPGEEREGDGPS